MDDPARQKLVLVGKKLLQERRARAAINSTSTPLVLSPNLTDNSVSDQKTSHFPPNGFPSDANHIAESSGSDEQKRLLYKVAAQSRRIEELIKENVQLQERFAETLQETSFPSSSTSSSTTESLEERIRHLEGLLQLQEGQEKGDDALSRLQSQHLILQERYSEMELEYAAALQSKGDHEREISRLQQTVDALIDEKDDLNRSFLSEKEKCSQLEEALKGTRQPTSDWKGLQAQLEQTVRERDLEISALHKQIREFISSQQTRSQQQDQINAQAQQQKEAFEAQHKELTKIIQNLQIEKMNYKQEADENLRRLRICEEQRASDRKNSLQQADALALLQMEIERQAVAKQQYVEEHKAILHRLIEEKTSLQEKYENQVAEVLLRLSQQQKAFRITEESFVAEIQRQSEQANLLRKQLLVLSQSPPPSLPPPPLPPPNDNTNNISFIQTNGENIVSNSKNDIPTNNHNTSGNESIHTIPTIDNHNLDLQKKDNHTLPNIEPQTNAVSQTHTQNVEKDKEEEIKIVAVHPVLPVEAQIEAVPKEREQKEPKKLIIEDEVSDAEEDEDSLETLQEKRIFQLLEEVSALKDQASNQASIHSQLSQRLTSLQQDYSQLSAANKALLEEIAQLRKWLRSPALLQKLSSPPQEEGSWLSFIPFFNSLVSRKTNNSDSELVV